MANLKRTHHQLEKAEKKLKKYSKRDKQLQIQFVRKQRKNGRFKTAVRLGRGEQNKKYGHGLIHRTVSLKTRITGDKPSFTKSLDSLKPKTFVGKTFKRSAQLINKTAHIALHTAEGTALTAETVALKTANTAERNLRYRFQEKYHQEAVDDCHRGTIATLVIAKDTVKGTCRHFKQKKQFRLEKARYKVKKAEYRIFKAEQYKPKLKSSRKELKEVSKKFRKRSKQYKIETKKFKTVSKSLKKEKKFQAKELKKQWRIADLSRPAPLILKPASYTGKRLSASGWQKTVNADENNDFLSVIDSVKRHGADKIVSKMQASHLKERNQKKKEKLEKNHSNTKQKLKKREDRLKNKGEQNKPKRKPKPPKKSFGDRFRNALREAFSFVKNIYNKEARSFLLACLVPILVIALILAFILMVFSSILSGSGFVLGTYASQDYDLSEAEKYYTKLAYEMNEKILRVSDSSNWKSGLCDFGANKKSLKDKPDNWYWGRSAVFDWNPVYDFDVYKLWSFLCAYYYDFDSKNGDIKYWKFSNDTEKLLDDIFNAEYEFVYWYDNTSGWEYRYNFDSRGYYSVEGSGVAGGYGYINISCPDALPIAGVTNGKTLYFDLSNGEVLNYNDDYSATGWYLKNQFIDDYDNSGTKFGAWYINGETCSYGIWQDGVLVIPMPYIITEYNWCSFLQKYDWKTDCRLYYNVMQKKTFDTVIEEKLKNNSHTNERLQYYKLLIGEDSGQMYGNHQTLRNMLPKDSVRDYTLKREFGYEMTGWNQQSDGLYQGIKVYADSGTALTAPFTCKITDVDTSENKITLRKENVQYWYDGSGGTKRDTEVTISNAVLTGDFKKGDTVKEGKKFAVTTAGNVNFHIYIDTDGCGWDYIDPRLVLY